MPKIPNQTTFLQLLIKFLNRIFRHPVQAEPSSYELQRHYDSMGNLLPPEQRLSRKTGYRLNELEAMEETFYEQLRHKRRERYEKAWQQARQRHSEGEPQRTTSDVSHWPGWDASTLQNVHNLFALYFHRERGLLEEERASALCGDLGDNSELHERRARFSAADINRDGWLGFDELLALLYNAEGTGHDSEAVREQAMADDHHVLMRMMMELAGSNASGAGSMTDVEAEAGAVQSEAEAARMALRPLARSCYEKSHRAEVLAAMSAQTQIRYGFL